VVCRILALKRSSTIGHSGSSLALAVTAVVKMPRHPYVPRTNLTGTLLTTPAFPDGAFLGIRRRQISRFKDAKLSFRF
jgi:hypothetical protein